MSYIRIRKNTVLSNSLQYSNYVYTYGNDLASNILDPQYLLPYQIESNKAYQNYQDCSSDIENFRFALQLEENYQTIMNLCVISLINRNFENFELLIQKAATHATYQTHHIILLIEYHLLIHDYDNAIKQLIFVFNNYEQQEVVQKLLTDVCSRKLFSRQHLSNLVQDNKILEQIIQINKQCYVQHHSCVSEKEVQSNHTQNIEFNIQDQYFKEQSISYILDQSKSSLSDQTQKTDQLSFISQNQNHNQINQQLDFSFIDIVIENPNLFSFQFRIPYMIGSYDIRRINKLSSKIAEGGNGEVFLAKHLQTNEIHALKVIKQQEDQQVGIILQEIIIQDKVQKLNSLLFLNLKPLVYIMKKSNLVDIYIPLELGQFSLYDYILEHQINELEYCQFYNLFIDFIITLHKNKYAHRDIKPQNILYINNQGWKLADFGESVNYIQAEDVYKIRGTFAFLPYNLRKSHKQKQSEIKQNLLYNDVYAVVCTLVLIKNPNFNSKQLTDYMDHSEYDFQLQQLLDNFQNLEHLQELKVYQIQYVEIRPIFKLQIKNQEDSWNFYEKLKCYKDHQLQLDYEFIQKLDEQLQIYKLQQQKHLIVYLSLEISQSFPFQIETFKNIMIFNFQRNLLADAKFEENSSIQYYYTIIDYFIFIRLYGFAIKVCDELNTREYDIQLHLQKIKALICLARPKEAKEELQLAYRYFLSVQSYSLSAQVQYCYLYQKLHNEAPQIKVDSIFQNLLIKNLDKSKSYYHEIRPDLTTPINLDIVEDKIHLKLRLDVLFEFVNANPYNIDQNKCQQTIMLFGDNFIQDGQLKKHDDLIKLIKENLVFWNSKYIQQAHIIGIGLNYLFNYYGLHYAALELGLYFQNILRNVGSCDSIVTHYEHLLETQIIIQNRYGEQPKILLDFNKLLQEVQYLSQFDQIYFNLKSMIIWLKIEIKAKLRKLNKEENEQFKSQFINLLHLLYPFINSEETKRLRQFLVDMIIQLLNYQKQKQVNLLQVTKKGYQILCQFNKRHFIFYYNLALYKARQFIQNHQNLTNCLSNQNLLKHQTMEFTKFCYNNLINIYLSPTKVVKKLEIEYGLNKTLILIASLNYKQNNDLGYFIYTKEQLIKIKRSNNATNVSTNIKRKIDQISLHSQFMNL